ncbi:MAG: hypothetical protein KIT45_06580 [Fimbriimonadia bacterium]|nr:hypothetical protein [Fimbriimonadia bacterium]
MKRWLFCLMIGGVVIPLTGASTFDGWIQQERLFGNPFFRTLTSGGDFSTAGGMTFDDAISREVTLMHTPLSVPEMPVFTNTISRDVSMANTPTAPPEMPVFTNTISRNIALHHVPVNTPGEIIPPTDSITKTYTFLNPCPDFDENGVIDDGDLLRVLLVFGEQGIGILEDVNFDGIVDDYDLLIILYLFGSSCAP